MKNEQAKIEALIGGSVSNAGLAMQVGDMTEKCACQEEYMRQVDANEEGFRKLAERQTTDWPSELPLETKITCERLCEKARTYAAQCLLAEATAQRYLRHLSPKPHEHHSRLLSLVCLVADSLITPFGKVEAANVI